MGKGVVSKIVPDADMPIVVGPDGVKSRVQVVMNPFVKKRQYGEICIENCVNCWKS